jgi:DNA-directed RNA polymerase specialized sigma24 family protein
MNQYPHHLLPIAYRAASRVLHNRLLAEEAGERAVHLYTLAILNGCPPEHPRAWLRSVAKRTALALLRSEWARTRSVDQSEIVEQQAPYQLPRGAGFDFVRDRLPDSLSPRQREALQAAVTCNSTRAAARCCGMQPRDFRRYLGTITRKAKELVDDRATADVFADDAVVQFHLDT